MQQILLHIDLIAKIENLERLIETVSTCARNQGFNPKRIGEIELTVEEAFVNICRYSYPEEPGKVEIKCKLDANRFIIEITHFGIPFDMKLLSSPNVTADIDQRKVGGLGVFLIKKFTDEVNYHRENDRNILNLIVNKDEE